MDENGQSKFEGWAIVEIMGHQRVAGYVTTEAFGSTVMFKVVQAEILPVEKTLEMAQYVDGECLHAGSKVRISRERAETYVGASSVYRMTPCTEEQAIKTQPAKIEILEKAAAKSIPANFTSPDEEDAYEGGHREDEDDEEEMPF